MAEEITVSWDEAVEASGFVKLESGKETVIDITNWKLVRVNKFKKEQVEFQAEVIVENGEKVEKAFTTVSNRLKTALRDLMSELKSTSVVRLSITPAGKNFDTSYIVKLLDI